MAQFRQNLLYLVYLRKNGTATNDKENIEDRGTDDGSDSDGTSSDEDAKQRSEEFGSWTSGSHERRSRNVVGQSKLLRCKGKILS